MRTLGARVAALERQQDPQQQVRTILLTGLRPDDDSAALITRIRSTSGDWCLDREANETENAFRARAGVVARARGPGVHLVIGEFD